MAEQKNEFLLKNHQSLLTGSTPFPEVNGTLFNNYRENNGLGCGCGRNNQNRRGHTQNSSKMNTTSYH